jgi:hypothetical protein
MLLSGLLMAVFNLSLDDDSFSGVNFWISAEQMTIVHNIHSNFRAPILVCGP